MPLFMALQKIHAPLREERRALPIPRAGEVLLRVRACGVCRTDLHLVDGELPNMHTPIVPGHEIVGEVVQKGADVSLAIGARVGVPWLGFSCGRCEFCVREEENLCVAARFTGYQLDGGFAEYTLADARYCFALPEKFDDLHVAPLLCAGLIGYRSLRMAGDARHLGIFGFGAAAHIIAQVAKWQGREVYAFTRRGDTRAQELAREVGACWAGDSETEPPIALDAAIIFAPVGALVPIALKSVRRGGTVVCGGIHMSDIPAFPYSLLWGERVVRSVANLTRRDAVEFLKIAESAPLRIHVERFALADANAALARLRDGALSGAAVLCP